MGMMVHSLLWVMQDLCHQPYAFSLLPPLRSDAELGADVLPKCWVYVCQCVFVKASGFRV